MLLLLPLKVLNIVPDVVSAHTLDTVCSVFVCQVSACTCVRVRAFTAHTLDTVLCVFLSDASNVLTEVTHNMMPTLTDGYGFP